MLDYRIVERAPFTIVGMKRSFDSDTRKKKKAPKGPEKKYIAIEG